jgi:hypothetical protein
MTAGAAGGGVAKQAADSLYASEFGAAFGDTYTLQSANCMPPSPAPSRPQDEYSSMSQSVKTPRFLYRNFLSSPIWTPCLSLISAVLCPAQEPGPAARTPFLMTVKKKRLWVLGMGRNRRARSAGSQA